MLQEQKDQLNLTQTNLADAPQQTASAITSVSQGGFQNRVKHIYLEQQNVYGRFVPFLLLKDILHTQIDTSGTSALVHMCSHNSPYLPLYLSTLKQDDPILNRPTNLGHTPLDVAGMYCRKEYVDLLRSKGAIDNGKVDCWAIQGANIDNWSGNVDPTKKVLIHWAAYNNLPQVLKKFHQVGANVNEADEKGNTPIDMAVINKSYESFQVLARLGYRPKQTLLQNAQSPYLTNLIKELDRSVLSVFIEKTLKMCFFPLVVLSQYLIADINLYLVLLTLVLFFYLAASVPGADSKTRKTEFFSELVNQRIIYASNHIYYVVLLIFFVLTSLQTLISLQVTSISLGFYFWFVVGTTLAFSVNLGVMIYGICTNTTPNQMFESHKNPHLWKKIDYVIHKNMVTRVYKNPNRKDILTNIQQYLNFKNQ